MDGMDAMDGSKDPYSRSRPYSPSPVHRAGGNAASISRTAAWHRAKPDILIYFEELMKGPAMKKRHYRIHLEPEPEGGFTVTVPVLPGCVTWGEDYDQALAMAQEAIAGYIEVLAEKGKPIPEEPVNAPVDTMIQVESPALT